MMEDIVQFLLVKDFAGIPLLVALLLLYSRGKRKFYLSLMLVICSIGVLKVLAYYILGPSKAYVLYLRAELLQGIIALVMIPSGIREIRQHIKRKG